MPDRLDYRTILNLQGRDATKLAAHARSGGWLLAGDALSLDLTARIHSKILFSYFWPLAAVAICTWLAFLLHSNLASVGFIYLIVVVLSAVHGA